MGKKRLIKWDRTKNQTRLLRVCCLILMCLSGSIPKLIAVNMFADTISLDLKEVKMEEFVEVMRQKTGLNFLYNALLLKETKPVSIKVKGEYWESVLKRVLVKEGLTYDLKNGIVVIKRVSLNPEDERKVKGFIVKGQVVDQKNVPLPGVTVLLKGTTIGTATDSNGRFSLEVVEGVDTLILRFVGMQTQYVRLDRNKTDYRVKMKEETEALEDIVVTGYGNVAKRNYTGAATTIKAKDIIIPGASTIDQMLQGVVPGMLVQTRTGMVGASPKIRVRGTSTLLGSQEPVWVVDGVIQRNPQPFDASDNTKFSMDADDISKMAGNAISWLNPHDIETITVLKDASATAIYGSQAANGVIVITTKKAQVGKVSVFYNGDFSIGQCPKYALYDRMNSQEMMQFSKEMYEERVSYPTLILPIGYAGLIERMLDKEITFEEMDREYRKMARQNTDWFKLLFRNSFSHKHALSISGGSEKIMNRTSFNVDQQMGEAKGNDLSNIGMISSTEIHIGKNFVINWSLNGSMRKVESFAYGVDPFTYAYETTRVIPAYNEDGTLYYHDKWGAGSFAVNDKNNYNYNILNELSNTGARTESRNWGTTLDVSWELFLGLQYQGVFSYNSSSSDVKQYATERSFYITQYRGYEYGTALPNSQEERSARIPYGGVLETGTTTVESVTVRNSLNYSKLLRDKHFVVFATGVETNSTKTTGGTNLKYGYLKDRGETFVNIPFMIYYGMDMENSEYAYGKTTVLNRKNNLLSVYAQGVYSYDDRYVVNVSARVDASNRFGQDKNRRFAPTWSAGVKWSVGNESFLKGSLWFNLLDITLSYGYQGNAVESVSPYLIARDGGIDASYSSYILKIKSLPYPNLGWEKTKSYNLGIDASFLDGRLNFGFNYYEKDSDVLSSRDIPHENGMAHSVVSGSKMKNTGFDFTVEVIPVRTDQFSWHLSVNSGATKNNVRRNDRINTLEDFLSGSAVVEGEPFSTFYSFQFKELDQKDGTPLFNKLDQTQVSSPVEYLVKSGKFTPDFSGGLNTMFKYRNWNLSAFFAMQWGGSGRLPELYRTEYNNGVPTPEQNVSRKLQRRWRKPGDQTIYPSIPGVGRAKKMSLPQEQTVWSTPIRSPYKMYNESDIRVAKTDMIRCTSISLGYEFNPEILRKLYIGRLSLIASMQNPFMWVRDKKWEGIDPETGNWPARRVTSLSLQVAF